MLLGFGERNMPKEWYVDLGSPVKGHVQMSREKGDLVGVVVCSRVGLTAEWQVCGMHMVPISGLINCILATLVFLLPVCPPSKPPSKPFMHPSLLLCLFSSHKSLSQPCSVAVTPPTAPKERETLGVQATWTV